MSWSDGLRLAFRALWKNKSRAMLTTLGVIIGVASVIAMVAIGTGAQERIAAQFESMGSHNLIIRPGTITRGGVRTGAGTITTLTMGDAEAIAELPMVSFAAPSVRASVQARYRGTNWGTSMEGVTPIYLEVRSWNVVEGEFFTEKEVMSASHVCVLGQTVARIVGEGVAAVVVGRGCVGE